MTSWKPRDHFAGLLPSRGLTKGDDDAASQLFILGISATAFSDVSLAESIDQGAHLQPHPYENSVKVDRFDVRLLLDELMQFKDDRSDEGGSTRHLPQKAHAPGSDSSSSEEFSSDDSGDEDEQFLDRERYRELKLRQREAAAEKANAVAWMIIHPVSSHEEDLLPPPPRSATADAAGSELEAAEQAPVMPPPSSRPLYLPELDAEEADVDASASVQNAYGAVGFSYSNVAEQDDEQVMFGPQMPQQQPQAVVSQQPAAEVQQEQAMQEQEQREQAPEQEQEAVTKDAYTPRFAVPEHLLPCLPDSERQHKILVQTARFVHSHGGQVEVLMRAKQGSNPLFNFLTAGDPAHPYYRWIVDTNPQELVKDAAPMLARTHSASQPAPSRVGQAQGSLPRSSPLRSPHAAAPALPSPSTHPAHHRLQLVMLQPAPAPPEERESSEVEGNSEDGDEGGGLGGLLGVYDDEEEEEGGEEDQKKEEEENIKEEVEEEEEAEKGEEEEVNDEDEDISRSEAGVEQEPSVIINDACEDDTAVAGSISNTKLVQFGPKLPVEMLRSRATIGASPVMKRKKEEEEAPASLPATEGNKVAPAAVEALVEQGASDEKLEEDEESGPEFIGPTLPVAWERTASPEPEVPGMESVPVTVLDDEPPEASRVVIDKLVGFVARNGAVFEATVRQREACNPKFSFLLPWNPYHAYYRRRLVEVLGEKQAAVLEKQQQLEAEQIAELEAACNVEGPDTVAESTFIGPAAAAAAAPVPVAKKTVRPVTIRLNPRIGVPKRLRAPKLEANLEEGELQSAAVAGPMNEAAEATEPAEPAEPEDGEGGEIGISGEGEDEGEAAEGEEPEGEDVADADEGSLDREGVLGASPSPALEPAAGDEEHREEAPAAVGSGPEGDILNRQSSAAADLDVFLGNVSHAEGSPAAVPEVVDTPESLELKQQQRRQRARELLQQKQDAERREREQKQRSAMLNHRRAFLMADDDVYAEDGNDPAAVGPDPVEAKLELPEEGEVLPLPLPSIETLQQQHQKDATISKVASAPTTILELAATAAAPGAAAAPKADGEHLKEEECSSSSRSEEELDGKDKFHGRSRSRKDRDGDERDAVSKERSRKHKKHKSKQKHKKGHRGEEREQKHQSRSRSRERKKARESKSRSPSAEEGSHRDRISRSQKRRKHRKHESSESPEHRKSRSEVQRKSTSKRHRSRSPSVSGSSSMSDLPPPKGRPPARTTTTVPVAKAASSVLAGADGLSTATDGLRDRIRQMLLKRTGALVATQAEGKDAS